MDAGEIVLDSGESGGEISTCGIGKAGVVLVFVTVSFIGPLVGALV